MELLELRIHGVFNTPPAEMLEVESDGVVRVGGDTLGSFWARRTDQARGGVVTPVAFSWGAQARTGGGATQAIGRALVHVGWFLLLPYALVNLAYWTREIPAQESGEHRTWEGGVGAGTVRLFGLILTLIAVAAFSAVAIDLVAVQCFRRFAEGTDAVCAALPSLFDGLRAFDADSRAALLGLIPIAVVFVLYWIGRRGRVRFDAPVEQFAKDIGGNHEKGLPLLSTRGFWAGARVRSTSEWLHVAASILLVLFLLAFDAAFPKADCVAVPADTLTLACLDAPRIVPLVFAVGAVAGIVIVGVFVVLASSTPMRDAEPQAARRRMPRWVQNRMNQPPHRRIDQKRFHALVSLVVASCAYVSWLILTSFVSFANEPGAQPQFTGLIGTPIVLMTLALFLALSALNWRQASPRLRTAGYTFLWVGGIGLLVGAILPSGTTQWLVTFLGAAVVIAFLFFVRGSTRDARALTPVPCAPETPPSAGAEPQFPALRFRAWDGHGAAVAMMLALFVSMALSSLLVLGLAAWLGAPQPAAADRLWRTPAAPPSAAEWNIPDAYERFAVVLTVIVGLTLILLIFVAVSTMRRLTKYTLPKLSWTAEKDSRGERTFAERGGVERPDTSGYPVKLEAEAERTRLRAMTRRTSHLAHRGEPLFAWISALAMTGFITLASPALFDFVKAWLTTIKPGLPGEIRTMTTAVLVALAVLAAGAVVANAVSSVDRPLGVFWDVVAFFPRAGHPFAPPCFAERTVPELAEYSRRFLKTTETLGNGRPVDRAIIMTAHSMGSTIAAATILSLRGETVGYAPHDIRLLTDRIAMLSYGSQLRAYFSRFFPSVFGCQVLGVPGLLGPSLFGLDPWKRQVEAEFACAQLCPPDASPHSLTGMLGAKGREVSKWRNLWRRSDYLGFPVYAYRDEGNPVDRGASETAPGYMWRIATHSDYLAVDQLALQREHLEAALRAG